MTDYNLSVSESPGTELTEIWIWRVQGSQYIVIDGTTGAEVSVPDSTAADPTVTIPTAAAPLLVGATPNTTLEGCFEALTYERNRIDDILSRIRNLNP